MHRCGGARSGNMSEERDRLSSNKRERERDPREPDRQRDRERERELNVAQSKDLVPLLKGWDFEPGTINVRKIYGLDGQPKLQTRLELGILQMEINGRPDGARPHGHDSLLDYYENQLKEHRKRIGSELGFHLSSTQCQS